MSSQEPPKKKSKQVENKQGTLLSWVKQCTSDTEPGVVEETIRIKDILGDPGADSGGEGKSKRAKKCGSKKSKERREELFSPFFTFFFFWQIFRERFP